MAEWSNFRATELEGQFSSTRETMAMHANGTTKPNDELECQLRFLCDTLQPSARSYRTTSIPRPNPPYVPPCRSNPILTPDKKLGIRTINNHHNQPPSIIIIKNSNGLQKKFRSLVNANAPPAPCMGPAKCSVLACLLACFCTVVRAVLSTISSR